MDREALTPFRCKTSSSLLSNNILRPETAAAVPVGLLFLSVTATRCFILALFSRGGEVSPQGAALRLLQPAKWHRPAPSSSQSQKPGRAELLRTAMAEVTAGCSESIFVLPQNLSLFPRLSLLILYGQTSLFSPSVVGSSSGRLFAFNSRLYSTTCWLCSLQTPAPAVCDSQVWKLCQRACMCAVQTGALRSALT